MSFKDLNIELEYRTYLENVIESFYIPILRNAKTYKRSIGFFSSSLLVSISYGLCEYIKNGGVVKLMFSPNISQEDYEAIKNGYKVLDNVVEESMIKEFKEAETIDDEKRYAFLSYLVSTKKIEIKLLITKENKSMYHEKMGILTDDEDNILSFSGSSNESLNGFEKNYETIDVYCGWTSNDNYMRCKIKDGSFDRLWEGKEKGVTTLEFPEAIKHKLFNYQKKYSSGEDFIDLDDNIIKEILEERKKRAVVSNLPSMNNMPLYDYQNQAIEDWLSHDSIGIYSMATGTGKTRTACASIVKLFEKKKKLAVVVVCPQIHLAQQWEEELEKFNIRAIPCYTGTDWKKSVVNVTKKFKLGLIKFYCLVVVNKTFTTEEFHLSIDSNKNEMLLCIDEAHNAGAKYFRKYLDVNFKYRLALSATFERHNDFEGNEALMNFFVRKSIEFTLEQAIPKYLCPYYYYPVICNLNDIELEEYYEISKKISEQSPKENKSDPSDYYKTLLVARARIIAKCESKIDRLLETIEPYKNDYNMLIYCGSVKYDEPTYENSTDEIKQISLVAKRLYSEYGMKTCKFTSEETPKQRKTIKQDFIDKKIQSLVAIRCLDEGMNIPGIKTAFILASSTNPKEYVQRRGRVLRLDGVKTHAIIYDFIALPYALGNEKFNPDFYKYDVSLVKRELDRIQEFTRISLNASDNYQLIDTLKNNYEIDLIQEDDLYD